MNLWVTVYRVGWLALTALVVIAVISMFIPQVHHYQELRRKEAQLREEIQLEEQILHHLKEQQERLRSDPRFIEKIAREEFGYVKPGETVFKFVDDEPATNSMPR